MSEPSASNFVGAAALDDNTSLGGDLVNLTQLTLDTTLAAGATTVSVAESIASINVPCYLQIAGEIIYAATKGSGDFTGCIRGTGGTSDVQHLSGTIVYLVAPANIYNQFKRAIIAIETALGAGLSAVIALIPVKASASDLDTGTNDGKFATAKALKDSHNVPSVVPGTTGNVLTSDGTDWTSAASTGGGSPPGMLFGLTLSNGTDATNDINIAVGKCRNDADTGDLTLASILVKQLDAAWSVGTNAGGLDTGSIGNKTYHIWLIKRTDTGVVDALFSASASAPTMPANYDQKRRIGSVVRAAGALKAFIQDGDDFEWLVPVNDLDATNPGTAAVTRTLTVPTGIRVKAILSIIGASNTGANDNPGSIFISDLSITDTAAGTYAANLKIYNSGAVANITGGMAQVYTNTSAQVRSRIETSTAATRIVLDTFGWIDTRGRLN